MEYENGYYFVKRGCDWEIMEIHGGCLYWFGCEVPAMQDEFDQYEIGDKVIIPEKYSRS